MSEGKSCCTPRRAARCPGSAQSAAAKRPRGSLGQRGSPQTVQEPRAEALLPAAGNDLSGESPGLAGSLATPLSQLGQHTLTFPRVPPRGQALPAPQETLHPV